MVRASIVATIVGGLLSALAAGVLAWLLASRGQEATLIDRAGRERLLTERIARLAERVSRSNRDAAADTKALIDGANELRAYASIAPLRGIEASLRTYADTALEVGLADSRSAEAAAEIADRREELVAEIDVSLARADADLSFAVHAAAAAVICAWVLAMAALGLVIRVVVVPTQRRLDRAISNIADLNVAIGAASDMIFVTDDTPIERGGPLIVYANEAMLREFGYPADRVIGMSPAFAFGDGTDRAVIRRIRAAMQTLSEAQGEFLAYRRDGSAFWSDWRGRALTDATAGTTRWIAIGRNTDERRRIEAELAAERDAFEILVDITESFVHTLDTAVIKDVYRHARELQPLSSRSAAVALLDRIYLAASRNAALYGEVLESRAAVVASEDLRSDLMAMVAHDLRNPVTTMLGYGELLEDNELDDDERRDASRQIVSAARRLESLANELLTFARLERGAYRPTPEPADLAEIVRDVLTYLPLRARVDVSGAAPAVVPTDAVAVRHVVENLLGNALKYSPNDSRVSVAVTLDDEYGWLTVSDRGIGIPAADLPSIFERAQRAGNVGSRRGTGFGLSFVRRLVLLLGGTIAVESREGEGSTFRVRLPRDRAAVEAAVRGGDPALPPLVGTR